MKTEQICIRLDRWLKEDLAREAALRGQEMSALIRTFVRDGLARHDAERAHIQDSLVVADERLRRLETMVGAVMHLHVEQQVLALPKVPGESHEIYSARLRGIYSDKIHLAADKATSIRAAVKVPAN